MRNFRVISCSLLLLFGLFGVLPARAQGIAGIRIQPSIIEERVDPGQTFSSVLHIANLGSKSDTFYLFKRDISGIREDDTPQFVEKPEKETGFEISSWVSLAQESITLAAGQAKEIPFSIKIPVNAGPGGHFGAILVTTQPPELRETGAAVAYGVGTIVALRISGAVVEEANIREFRTDRAIYGKPKVKFITRVENLGNVLVRPRGPLEITNMFGKKVATIVMNNEGAAIFPKGIRQFEASWQGEGLPFGRYEAVMSLGYGEDEKKTLSRALSFWILPINIILPILGGILGLILGAFVLVKFYIRRKLRKLHETTKASVAHGRFSQVREGFARPSGAPFSRLAIIALVLLLFTLLFLAIVFFFFA